MAMNRRESQAAGWPDTGGGRALGTGDFGAVQASGDNDLDAFRAEPHGVAYGALHGTAKLDTPLQLLGDTLGNQHSG